MNSDLLDLAHELPGWEYKWTCAICLINAKAGILLEFQLRDIDNHLFVYFDTDQTPWVQCRRCKHKFHLKCVTCFTAEELLATGAFVCCANWIKILNLVHWYLLSLNTIRTCLLHFKLNHSLHTEIWRKRSSRTKAKNQHLHEKEGIPTLEINWTNGTQQTWKRLWKSKWIHVH